MVTSIDTQYTSAAAATAVIYTNNKLQAQHAQHASAATHSAATHTLSRRRQAHTETQSVHTRHRERGESVPEGILTHMPL